VAPSVPIVAPTEIRAGDTVQFTRAYGDFPPADGWTLSYTLNGQSKARVDATTSGGGYLFTVPATKTAQLLPGTYRYVITASLAGARHTVEEGAVRLAADPVESTAGAQEHQDEKELRLIDLELLARAQSDHTEYSIGDRSLKRESLESLRTWRTQLRARIARRRRGGRLGMVAVTFPGRRTA
jgi:hypothetical protein